MNLLNYFKRILFFLSVMLFVACESNNLKSDNAFEMFKKEKMMVKESAIINTKKIQIASYSKSAKKAEKHEEWEIFEIEAKEKICINENTIKEIKKMPDKNANFLRRASNLEKENNDLRMQIEEFKKERKKLLKNFKSKINNSVDEIQIELKKMKQNK